MRKTIATMLCLALLAMTAACCADTTTNVFSSLAGLNWTYCSGAGAWSSDLTIRADGSFTCQYHDSDMGDTAESYPDGTVYFGTFSGRISLAEQADENTWKIRVDKLEREPAKEEILDGVRYIPTEGCGLSEGDVMTLYAPGTPVSALSEEMQFWAHVMDQENQETLENWFLASEANESGFVGYPAVWEDLTAEQLAERSGLTFGLPEDAGNVIYRYLPGEGLAEVQFSRELADGEKDHYCVRGLKQAMENGELINISGMYYDWTDVEKTGFGKCYGTFGRAQTDGEAWVEQLLWYDPEGGIVYSMAVFTADPGSLDIEGVAEKLMGKE